MSTTNGRTANRTGGHHPCDGANVDPVGRVLMAIDVVSGDQLIAGVDGLRRDRHRKRRDEPHGVPNVAHTGARVGRWRHAPMGSVSPNSRCPMPRRAHNRRRPRGRPARAGHLVSTWRAAAAGSVAKPSSLRPRAMPPPLLLGHRLGPSGPRLIGRTSLRRLGP